jgi:putrescine carbamoyltransferase
LRLSDWSREEVLDLVALAKRFKEARANDAVPPLLKGKNIAMYFELPSTRTRVSFDHAMSLLGGHAVYLKPGEVHIPPRESLSDMARVLSRLSDGIVVRAWRQETIEDIAEAASVPVFNALSNLNHPTQVLADLLTMMEHTDKPIDQWKVVFVGDRTNVCYSLLQLAAILGFTFVQLAPRKYQLSASDIAALDLRPNQVITTEHKKHLDQADFVYTDLWWWIDQEHERHIRKDAFYDTYQVNEALLAKTNNPDVLFLHCLPANREMEVTSEVLDGPRSLAFEQTENRLYVQMALLAHLLHPTRKRPDQDHLERTRIDICDMLKRMNR